MDIGETRCSKGYGEAPWIFKGRYTLGGFFLASYDDSPAGVFDELVVIAGLVWNRPTSCAWAAKVLVNSNEACDHGRKEVGLPSQVARISKRITAITRQPKSKVVGFLDVIGMGATFCSPMDHMNLQVTEIKGLDTKDSCNINLTTIVPGSSFKWKGPVVKMSLPSYSGLTEHNPSLLKYACQIECRVRAVQPAAVAGPATKLNNDRERYSVQRRCTVVDSTSEEHMDSIEKLSMSVMLSKPILALEFSCLKMKVEAPIPVSSSSRKS